MSTRPHNAPLVGQTLSGRYHVEVLLGAGMMGEVYAATDKQTGETVAVKILNPMGVANPAQQKELIKRFEREIATLKLLQHPNIVSLRDSGQTDQDIMFLVLELLEGHELRDDLRAGEALEPARVAHIARQIADALSYAHDRGIVHRDLKPENVFLCSTEGDDDFVRVVDFGIARLQETHHEVTQVTKAGSTLGTPRYMSPEQALGQKITPATDIYSLGIMLYEMASGDAPFSAGNEMMVALMQINEEPPLLEVPDMAADDLARWRQVVHECLNKEPAQRTPSAGDLAAQLRALGPVRSAAVPVAEPEPEPEPEPNPAPAEAPAQIPNWAIMAAAGIVVALVIALIATF